jgi:hypothetical protein
MTNLFFQRMQISGITPDNHFKKPARSGLTRYLAVFIAASLVLLAVSLAIFMKTGQGGHADNAASPGYSKPAPLDLFP